MNKQGVTYKMILYLALFLFSLLSFAQQEIKVMSYNIRLDVASDGENRWDARKDIKKVLTAMTRSIYFDLTY